MYGTPYFLPQLYDPEAIRARAIANAEARMQQTIDSYKKPQGYTQTPRFDLNTGVTAGLGALSLASQGIGMANETLGLRDAPAQQYTPGVRPMYGLGQSYNEASGARPQGATGGEILSGIGQGASIGTSIVPGIGTAVGAVLGGLTSLIGGGIRKRRQQRERSRALRRLGAQQADYNQASSAYAQRQNMLEDYYDSL